MKTSLWTSLVVLLALGAGQVVATEYTVTPIAEIDSISNSKLNLNNLGQIAWTSRGGGSDGGAFFYDGTTIHELEGAEDSHAYTLGMNNLGQIVGFLTPGGAFLYDGDTMHNLGFLGSANDINDNGQIVGVYRDRGHRESHAFLHEDDTLYDLGTLGGLSSMATAINDHGQIVGMSKITGSASNHAFLYEDGTMHDLGTLDRTSSLAWDINNSGQIVGMVFNGDWGDQEDLRAFLYENGTMHDLGTLGGADSIATGINDRGQVVGWSEFAGDRWMKHPFLYENGQMVDLNNMLPEGSEWELLDWSFSWDEICADINDSGQIVTLAKRVNPTYDGSYGRPQYYGTYIVLLTPKPIQVSVDIKPEKCPNPLNVRSRGLMRVALLGSEDFDVAQVDPESITLAGVGPVRIRYRDGSSVFVDEPNECDCPSIPGPDGYEDMFLKFRTQTIVKTLGEVSDGETWTLEMTGSLYDGTEFTGKDCVVIKKQKCRQR